jgi:hypothetical protein
MSIPTAQHILSLAIEVITIGALFGFSAAIASDLYFGFRRFRAAKALPAPAAQSTPRPMPAPAPAPAEPQPLRGTVVELRSAMAKTDATSTMLRRRSLENLTVKQLRDMAADQSVKGRSKLRTKAQLIEAIAAA